LTQFAKPKPKEEEKVPLSLAERLKQKMPAQSVMSQMSASEREAFALGSRKRKASPSSSSVSSYYQNKENQGNNQKRQNVGKKRVLDEDDDEEEELGRQEKPPVMQMR